MTSSKNGSDWRRRAREVILPALAELSPGAGEAEARATLRRAYPFGQRKGHRYKMWLAEVRDQLAAWKARRDASQAPGHYARFVGVNDKLWLEVACRWCGDEIPGGCLVCVRLREAVDTLARDATFRSLREGARRDPVARLALLDFCEERLGSRPPAPEVEET